MMRSYQVFGTASKDVLKVTPPIYKGKTISSWVSANTLSEAKKEFRIKMFHCYGIEVTDISVNSSI